MPDVFSMRGGRPGHARLWARAAGVALASSLAVLALARFLAAAPASAGRAPASRGGAGSAPTRQLLGVSCVSASDCWAVGAQTVPGAMVNLVEHWDGSRWSRVPGPGPARSVSGQLTGVSCASASDCWATGLYVTRSNRVRAAAEHWDGTAWVPVRVSQPPQEAGVGLTGASCITAAACVAVGSTQAHGLGEFWNGSTWAIARSPHRGASTVPARVSCSSGTDCWAAGYWSSLGRKGSLTEHWNGTVWSVARTPTSRNSGASLSADSCLRSACMAVGSTGAGSPLAERWDGSTWALTTVASAPGAHWSQFDGVSCTSTSACMAVGSSASGAVQQALAEQWNGQRWALTATPILASSAASQLNDISCVTATDCWAVGSHDMPTRVATLIEHWNGSTWSRA
jgi:hypothetical protein